MTFRVDFSKGLDSLEAILDSVRLDCPDLLTCDSVLEDARRNYRRWRCVAGPCRDLCRSGATIGL